MEIFSVENLRGTVAFTPIVKPTILLRLHGSDAGGFITFNYASPWKQGDLGTRSLQLVSCFSAFGHSVAIPCGGEVNHI